MKKKPVPLSVIAVLFVFVGLIYSIQNPFVKPSEEMINKVIVAVTLPDSTTLKATVNENGLLEITGPDASYSFMAVITSLNGKTAYMEAIDGIGCDEIKFEILDVISLPKSKFEQRGGCTNGKCCVTCNGWTACACAVEFPACPKKDCCCDPCCPDEPIG